MMMEMIMCPFPLVCLYFGVRKEKNEEGKNAGKLDLSRNSKSSFNASTDKKRP
jgi:hypothetical protein